MRRLAWLLLLACRPAGADDDARGIAVRASARWQHDEPLLHLDAGLPVHTEVFSDEEQELHDLELGPRARLVTAARWWQSGLAPAPTGPPSSHDLDVVARGWRLAAALSYDLGPFRVAANAATGHVDSRFEQGTYGDLGLSISRTFQLSRWMHGWLSLGISHRQWISTPPPGESNDATIMLSAGTTWR